MKKLLLIPILPIVLSSISLADINIEIFKDKSKIYNKVLTEDELNKGIKVPYFEDYYFIDGITNKKPVVKNEKMGIEYKIKTYTENKKEEYMLVLDVKTENMIEYNDKKNIVINDIQRITNVITKFGTKKQKLLLEFQNKREVLNINVGKNYQIKIEKI